MGTDRTSGFGGKLRAARERRGVPLRDIANRTKISVGVLEALERNDFSRLPGGIFGRAFVRSYAIEVGLDPEETIEEFLAELPRDASATDGHRRSEQVEDGEALEADRRMATTFLRLIGVSIVVVGFLLYVNSVAHHAPPAAEPAADSAPSSPAPALQPPVEPAAASAPSPTSPEPPSTGSESSASTVSPSSAAESVPPPVPAAVSDRLTVEIVANDACWVSATVDGTKAVERLLQPGDTRTFEVHREAILTAGNAAAVSMKLNGVAAKPLGKPGEVVTTRLNPSNYKEYLARP